MSELCSRSEFLILDVLRFDHLEKLVTEWVSVPTVIKSEARFVKVGFQMLCTHMMPRADIPRFRSESADSIELV